MGRREWCISMAVWTVAPRHTSAARPQRIGLIHTQRGAAAVGQPLLEVLAAAGLRPGQNLIVETRIVPPQPEAFQRGAEELVRADVDVIVTVSTPAAVAASRATRAIPIVMAGVASPVEQGLVASLSHPGGNLTGVMNIREGFRSRMLALLKEAVPRIARVAIVLDPEFQLTGWPDMTQVARSIGVEPVTVPGGAYDDVAVGIRQARADALLVLPSARANALQRQLVGFALTHRLPSMFGNPAAVEAGGLMCHYADWADIGRKAGRLVVKILNGARPAELPVEQPDRFDLILNLRTARALGIQFPQSLRVQATSLIE